MRATFACLTVLLLASPLLAADEIVIGMSAAFTGPSRGLGIEFYRGAVACFDEVNRKGGVHGKQIRLVALDDGYDPVKAFQNTLKLIRDHRAFLLFGSIGTPTTTRVLPLLERYKADHIYLFCPYTGAEPTREGPYCQRVFNLRASYREETCRLVDNLIGIGRNKIAVFYQIDSYGRSGWDGIRRALQKHKLKIAAEATYRRGAPMTESMKRQVKILRDRKPDVVICVGAYAACAGFIRDARDEGWDVPIANLSFVGSENLLALLNQLGKKAERDYTRDLINSQVVPNYMQTDLAGVKLYRDLMDKHKPQPPSALVKNDYSPLKYSFTSLEGFLSARLVVEVLQKAGPKCRRESLRKAAESLDKVDLGLGINQSLSAKRHQALDEVWFSVVDKGRFVPLLNADWKRWRK